MKKAISVTLSLPTIGWLKAQVATRKNRSLSEALDHAVLRARGLDPHATPRDPRGMLSWLVDPETGWEKHAEDVRKDLEASLEKTEREYGENAAGTLSSPPAHSLVAEEAEPFGARRTRRKRARRG